MKKLKLNSSYRLLKAVSNINNLTRKEEKILNLLWNTILEKNNNTYYILYTFFDDEEINNEKQILLKPCIADFIDRVSMVYDVNINELIKLDVFTIEEA